MATRNKHWLNDAAPDRVDARWRDETMYFLAKRALDMILATTALFALLPVIAVVALLIKLDSPGPVFFSHERMGYDSRRRRLRTFKMLKFRSMVHNCDQSLHQQHIREWARRGTAVAGGSGDLVKISGDPRITRVGRVLRKTSIDELPQLWNVVRGEMSLVGPRPVPLYEVSEYSAWHRQRLEATPGITCLWQVKGRGLVGMDDMVRMDLEYIQNRSLWLDLKIIALTIPVVLSGHGAA